MDYSGGVLLSHLVELVGDLAAGSGSANKFTADDLCRALLSGKLADPASGSYANFLLQTTTTQQPAVVNAKQADVFVSYVWAVDVRHTLAALQHKFKQNTTTTTTDPYVWMDVVCLDQHAGVEKILDFATLKSVFGSNLERIGKAMIVMIPAMAPVAASRAWCCFEWYTLVTQQIDYDTCVTQQEEEHYIKHILQHGMQHSDAMAILSSVNVTQAKAREPADERAILALLHTAGPARVNDVVRRAIQANLVQLVQRAGTRAVTNEEHFNVLYSTGLLHQVLNQHGQAVACLQRALQLSPPLPDDKLLQGRQLLAQALERNDDLSAAQLAYEEILLLHEKDSPERLNALGPLAALLRRQGLFAQSLDVFKNAIEIAEQLGEDGQFFIATALTEMGSLYFDLRQGDNAAEVYTRALEIWERDPAKSAEVSGGESAMQMSLLSVLNGLGRAESLRGQHKAALARMERAENIAKMAMGEDSVQTAYMAIGIATELRLLGELDAALTKLSVAMPIITAAVGTEHVYVLSAMKGMADVYLLQGRNEDAARVLQESVDILRRSKAGGGKVAEANLGVCLLQLSRAQGVMGAWLEALRSVQESLVIYDEHLPVGHVDIARALFWQGKVHFNIGQLGDAAKSLTHALAGNSEEEEINDVAELLLEVGSALLDQQGDVDGAVACFEKVVAAHAAAVADKAQALIETAKGTIVAKAVAAATATPEQQQPQQERARKQRGGKCVIA